MNARAQLERVRYRLDAGWSSAELVTKIVADVIDRPSE
jgi:hypothetical protein